MVSPCVYKTNGHFWKWKLWMASNGLSVGGLIRNGKQTILPLSPSLSNLLRSSLILFIPGFTTYMYCSCLWSHIHVLQTSHLQSLCPHSSKIKNTHVQSDYMIPILLSVWGFSGPDGNHNRKEKVQRIMRSFQGRERVQIKTFTGWCFAKFVFY